MINNWIKIGLRNIAKNKLTTFINIFGLTIGIVGVVLTLLYWNDELSYNQWNSEKENIYQVSHQWENNNVVSVSVYPLGPKMKEVIPEVEDYAILNSNYDSYIVKTDGKSQFLDGVLSSTSNFFEFFPFEFMEGSSKNALENRQSIAISEAWSKKLFGEKPALGKNIEVGNEMYTISGVYRNDVNSSVNPDAVINMNIPQMEKEYGDHWGMFTFLSFVKLKEGTDPNSILPNVNKNIIDKNVADKFSKFDGITPDQWKEKYGTNHAIFDKLKDLRLFGTKEASGIESKANVSLLYIMTGLSTLILILSCVNFINLSTASAMKRAKEVGVRKALGSSRQMIIIQFVFENFIICLISFLIALTVIEWIIPYFNEYFNKELKMDVGGIYPRLILVLIVVLLLSGLIPALYLSNFKPLKVLKGNFARSGTGIWLRNFMLGLQFVISFFFMVSGFIIYQQVKHMINRDLGFNADQVVAVYFNNNSDTLIYDKYEIIKQEFTKIEGVLDVSSGMRVPGFMSSNSSNVEYKENTLQTIHAPIDYNFFEFMEIGLAEGRFLSPDIQSDTIENIVVNQAFVKEMKIDNPVGKKVRSGLNDKTFTIVGVAEDYFVEGFTTKMRPALYFHWDTTVWMKRKLYMTLFKIEPAKMETALAEIESRWKKEIEPGFPYKYRFVDEQFAKTYGQYQKQESLFLVLTILVIVISLLGLLGLISFVLQQRMREIAIRKTLGADTFMLIRLIAKEYVVITLISFIISIPVTYYFINNWLEDFVYRIDIPWIAFAFGFVFFLSLVFMTICLRTWQAGKINPVKYLKYE